LAYNKYKLHNLFNCQRCIYYLFLPARIFELSTFSKKHVYYKVKLINTISAASSLLCCYCFKANWF